MVRRPLTLYGRDLEPYRLAGDGDWQVQKLNEGKSMPGAFLISLSSLTCLAAVRLWLTYDLGELSCHYSQPASPYAWSASGSLPAVSASTRSRDSVRRLTLVLREWRPRRSSATSVVTS